MMPQVSDKPLISVHLDEISFGGLLARFLDKAGISQTDFAKRVKTTQPVISSICNSKRQCGIRLATRMADALALLGPDRLALLSAAKTPKWKGFGHSLFGPEAVLYDVLSKALIYRGIDPKEIQSVTPLDPQRASGCAVIVMKDGGVYSFELTLRQHEAPRDVERHIGGKSMQTRQQSADVLAGTAAKPRTMPTEPLPIESADGNEDTADGTASGAAVSGAAVSDGNDTPAPTGQPAPTDQTGQSQKKPFVPRPVHPAIKELFR